MVNLVTVHYAYVHKYDFLMQMGSIINFLKISLPLSLSSLFSPPPLLLSLVYHRNSNSALASLTTFALRKISPLSFQPPSLCSLLDWPKLHRLTLLAALLPGLLGEVVTVVPLQVVLSKPLIKSTYIHCRKYYLRIHVHLYGLVFRLINIVLSKI